jgi:UDP-N-acetylglucosamine diphosphorylase/glucosamine-1-phosphate N-acetyltransferase
MKAVILAAGKGARMWPLTASRPKPMIPIANKPIIEHSIIHAKKAGINDFVIVLGYKSEYIKEYLGNGEKWNIHIDYCLQQQARGTANALQATRGIVSEKFLVLNGDTIINEEDIRNLTKANQITISVRKVTNPTGLGIIEERDGSVQHIFEKPETSPFDLVNTGAYLMTKQIFPAIDRTLESGRGEFELTQSLEILIGQGIPVHCITIENWQDISYPWDLLDTNARIMSSLAVSNNGIIEENVHIEGQCHIEESSIIRSGSYIVGPVCIGKGCNIGPNCYIRPATSIGNNCHIGAGVEIKNSIIMSGTKIPHLSYIGDSIIGEECNLGAGTKTANLRLDKNSIRIDGNNTKRNKLGVIIGDKVMTGINCSINAGTVIGNNAWIGPNMLVSGTIPDNTHMITKKTS